MLPSRLSSRARSVRRGVVRARLFAAGRRSSIGSRAARTNGRISSRITGAVSAARRIDAFICVEVAGERAQVVEGRAEHAARSDVDLAERRPRGRQRARQQRDRALHVQVLLGDRAEGGVGGVDELRELVAVVADRLREDVEVVDQVGEVLPPLGDQRCSAWPSSRLIGPRLAEHLAEVAARGPSGPGRRRRTAAAGRPGCRRRAPRGSRRG